MPREGGKSVGELMDYVNSLAAGLQDHLEEMQKERESLGLEETEEEDKFEDAKETGSITSNTSKTQRAAEDSQTETAKSAVPQLPEEEGGHQVHGAVGHGDG